MVEEIIGRLPELTGSQLGRLEDEIRRERQRRASSEGGGEDAPQIHKGTAPPLTEVLELDGQASMCVEALCRAPIGSAALWPSRSCSIATTAFKPACRNSETCGSGLVDESGTLRRYRQGRVEDLEGSIDRCLHLSDLTAARSDWRPNTREPLPPIN